MLCDTREQDGVNSYALVSYIPDPLRRFLDDLRRELVPGCVPAAHVTVLPPRPLSGTVEEAIDYQILVGPSGELVRLAGAEGQRRMPEIRARLAELFRDYLRDDGVFMPSSSWLISARKSR